MAQDLLLSLGFDTAPAISQLDAQLANFERRRKLNIGIDSSSINKANQSLSEFDRSFSRIHSHFVAFAAGATIIGGVVRGIEELVKNTVKFEAELAKVSINLNATQSQLQNFGKSLFDIARQTQTSFDAVTEVAQKFAQQGLNAAETAKRTKDALILMRISGTDAKDAVEVLTSTINEFNKESLTSTDIINKFASVQGKFAVSSKTIAEAVQRVGATANESGVSLNQLIALITSIAQTTQRDGPAIGTALNTIFSNERKQTTIDAFRRLGIEVEKVPGQLLPAIDILKNLAFQYDKLSDSQKGQLTSVLGGSRQLNILTAIVGDLNKQYGIYNSSLTVVNGATDNAIQKNNQLNQTLAAQANVVKVNLEQISASVGKLTFGPVLKNLFGILNGGSDVVNGATGIGKEIGKGILSGIGQAIAGPGLILGGAIFASLLGKIGTIARESFASLLTINQGAEQQKELQSAINSALKQQGVSYEQLLSLGKNRINQEEFILNLIKQQSAAQIGQEALLGSLAGSLASQGAYANNGRVKFKASGFTPSELTSAVQNEQTAISRGVGGSFGASPVIVPNFSIGGEKQTIVANNKEFLVPTRNLAPGYTGPDQTSIINPQMIAKLGGLPANAIPITASGYVPQSGNPDGSDIIPILSALGLAIGGGSLLSVFSELKSGKSGEFRKGFSGSGNFYRKREASVIQGTFEDLIGDKALKRRTKRGLILQGKEFGFNPEDLQSLTKVEIANLLNTEVLKDNPFAYKALLKSGYQENASKQEAIGNFDLLRGLGNKAKGFIPNHESVLNFAHQVSPDIKKRLISLSKENPALFNFIAQNMDLSNPNELRSFGEFANKKFIQITPKSLGGTTMMLDVNQNSNELIKQINSKAEAFKLDRPFNFASGYTESKFDKLTEYEKQIFVNNPESFQSDELISQIIKERRGGGKQKDRFPGLNPVEQQILANEADIRKYKDPQIQQAIQRIIGERTPSSQQPSISASNSIDKASLIAQARSLGVKGIGERNTVETLQSKIAAAQNANSSSGGLPPNTPIAPPAPSAPSPPPRKNTTASIPLSPIISNNSGVEYHQSFKDLLKSATNARGIPAGSTESGESIRQKILAFDQANGKKTPDFLLNPDPNFILPPQASGLQKARGESVRSQFNVSDVNLLNNNSSSALNILTPNGGLSPTITSRVKSRLTEINQGLKNPLSNPELDKLTEDVITQKLTSFIKEADRQISKVSVDKNKLKSTLSTILNKSNSQELETQIQNSISSATDLTPKQKQAYRKAVINQTLSGIDPQSRNNPQVQKFAQQIADQALGNITNQISLGQNNIARSTNQTNFVGGINEKFGGSFANLNGKKAQSFIEEYVQKQVSLGANEDAVRNEATSIVQGTRREQQRRRSNFGLQAAFTIPLLAGGITGALGDNVSSATKNNINGVTNSIATGATIASLAPGNPTALAAGAFVGVIGTVITALQNLGPSVEDASKKVQEYSDKQSSIIQSASGFLTAQNNLKEVIQNGGSPAQIALAQKNASISLNNITDPNLKLNLIGKNSNQQQDILLDFQVRTSQEIARKKTQEDLAKLDIDPFGISRLATTGELGPNSRRFENRFNGEEGQKSLKNFASDFIEGGGTTKGLDSVNFKAIGYSPEEIKNIKDAVSNLEKLNNQITNLGDTTQKTTTDLVNFNRNLTLTLTKASFQNNFSAQNRFNTTQNQLDLTSGLLNNRSEFTNPLEFIGANQRIKSTDIQNNSSLQSSQAVGELISNLSQAFSNEKENPNSDEATLGTKEIIEGLKSGSLTGNDALKSLDKIIEALSTTNNGLTQDLEKIKNNFSEKLTTIAQNTKDQLAKNDINSQKEIDAFQIGVAKNFGGGLNSFLNPGSIKDITNPVFAGASSNKIFAETQRPLNRLASKLEAGIGISGENQFAINQNTLASNAGRGSFNLIKGLQNVLGGDLSSVDQKFLDTNTEKGRTGQIKNDLVDFTNNSFDTLSLNNSFPGRSRSLDNVRRRLDKSILDDNSIGAASAYDQLRDIRSSTSNPARQKELDQVINVLGPIVQKIGDLNNIGQKANKQDLGNQAVDSNINNEINEAQKQIPNYAKLTLQAQEVSLSVSNLDSLSKQLGEILKSSDKNKSKDGGSGSVDINTKLALDLSVEGIAGIIGAAFDISKNPDLQKSLTDFFNNFLTQWKQDNIDQKAQITPPPRVSNARF